MPSQGRVEREDGDYPSILHVSADFPDPIEPFKTPVIQQLIALTREQFDHRVVSINRVGPSGTGLVRSVIGGDSLTIESQPFEHGTALTYVAPGKGVRHRTKLEQLGRYLVDEIAAMERKPDLLIGHKLTVEGVAVRLASELTGIPYALSIQGKTDVQILRSRPDLKALFRTIFHGAKTVFPFAPWALEQVEERLGKRSAPTLLLPCPTELDQPTAPQLQGDGLISVFHLKNHATKNLAGIVEAYRRISASGAVPPKLDVIGGGTDEELAACRASASDFPQINFTGAMDREELRARMNRASGFVMPSLRESFGLVFIEALFAGIPIIHPRGSSVDGYFDEEEFAIGVDARDPGSIANAIGTMIENEVGFKEMIGEWQQSDKAKRFTRIAIGSTFANGLNRALERL